MNDVTLILQAVGRGEKQASEELRRAREPRAALAHAHLGGRRLFLGKRPAHGHRGPHLGLVVTDRGHKEVATVCRECVEIPWANDQDWVLVHLLMVRALSAPE